MYSGIKAKAAYIAVSNLYTQAFFFPLFFFFLKTKEMPIDSFSQLCHFNGAESGPPCEEPLHNLFRSFSFWIGEKKYFKDSTLKTANFPFLIFLKYF